MKCAPHDFGEAGTAPPSLAGSSPIGRGSVCVCCVVYVSMPPGAFPNRGTNKRHDRPSGPFSQPLVGVKAEGGELIHQPACHIHHLREKLRSGDGCFA